MKLYLSSYRIPNKRALAKLFTKPITELSGLLIMNAKENDGAKGKRAISTTQEFLLNIGFKRVEVCDLRTLASESFDIEQKMLSQDFLYFAGGRSYELITAINDTMSSDCIKSAVKAGVVYIGESAGATVAGPSLVGFDSVEKHRHSGRSVDIGMNMVDTLIVPHNDSPYEKYRGRAPNIQAQNPGIKVLPLNDNQALVIDGDSEEIVSGDDNHSRAAYQ